MSKPTNATPDTTLPGGDTGPLLWYDQPSTAIEDLDMKGNATPEPLSCQLHGLFLGTLCPACSAGHPAEANLKAQPAPVPLAEDEALIADLEVRGDLPGTYALLIRNAAKRLSLRSGKLAQVLALCEARWQDAGYVGVSEAMNDEAVFLCKLRKAIEGAE